jgi:hypothetical protein
MPFSLEVVVIGFDDVSVETAHALVTRMNATGQVRIVSAVVACRDGDGTASTAEWLDARTVFDLTADLAARQMLGIDRIVGDDLAAELQPGSTMLLLVVEHLWARPLCADVELLGGRCLASHVLPVEEIYG